MKKNSGLLFSLTLCASVLNACGHETVRVDNGNACKENGDCVTNFCNDKGICEGRPNGEKCVNASDCASEFCNASGICVVKVCDKDADCESGTCSDGTCVPTKPECEDNSDCESGTCSDGTCVPTKAECEDNSDCESGTCSDGTCVPTKTVCQKNEDCASGLCEAFECVASCKADSDCAAGFVCTKEVCVSDRNRCLDLSRDGSKLNDSEYHEIVVSKFNSADYSSAEDGVSGVVFSDRYHAVTGFFGVSELKDADQLIKKAGFASEKFQKILEMDGHVPAQSWSGAGFDSKSHQMADFDVVRTRYDIELNDLSLEAAAKKYGEALGLKNIAFKTDRKCEGNLATLMIAQSIYSDKTGLQNLYSGALMCSSMRASSSFNSIETVNMLEDVLSGSMATFKNVKDHSYRSNGKVACQDVRLSNSINAVDFIWVIDNSSSMEDELESLKNGAESFINRLNNLNIDYRFAVTTTDAYTLDERGILDSVSEEGYSYREHYRVEKDGKPVSNAYMNMLGIRTPVSALSTNTVVGFIDGIDLTYNHEKKNLFMKSLTSNDKCSSGNGKNLCGFGIKDGFKSGLYTLSRLAIDIRETDSSLNGKDLLSEEDKQNFDSIVQMKSNIAKSVYHEGIINDIDERKTRSSIQLRDHALKYIIWITDDTSRQFKEKQAFSTCHQSVCSDENRACLTGFKVDNGKMRTGGLTAEDTDAGNVCSPTMLAFDYAVSKNIQDAINDESGNTTFIENYTIDEIKADSNLAEYNNILSYYLSEYRKFAGSGGIAGFAFVGDKGNRNGGHCVSLKVCNGICYKGANDKVGEMTEKGVGCYECDGEWSDDPSATVGANYAVPYIHLARFLSLDENGNGKEGGYSSVCSDNYEDSLMSIFEDVSGRVEPMALKNYPISSTLKVHVYKSSQPDDVIYLTRGASKNGFIYDHITNMIVFSGISEAYNNGYDMFSVSYAAWSNE